MIGENIQDTEMKIDTILNYTGLLIAELKQYNEVQVLVEIQDMIQLLTELANQQKSDMLEIETLILQSNITLIDGNIKEAEELIEKALESATMAEIPYLIKKSAFQRQILEDQFDNWTQLSRANISLAERIEATKVEKYIQDAIKYHSLNLEE